MIFDLRGIRILDWYLQELTISLPSYNVVSVYFVNRQTTCMPQKRGLAVLKKSDNIENKNNKDHNMELVEQLEKELLNSKLEDNALLVLKTPQYHIIYNTQSSRQTCTWTSIFAASE